MTRATLKKKLDASPVVVSKAALELMETREVLALIRLAEERQVFIEVKDADPVPFSGIEENYG